MVAFTNCSSIRTAKPNAADGEYLITPSLYPDRVIKVYCSDMDSAPTTGGRRLHADLRIADKINLHTPDILPIFRYDGVTSVLIHSVANPCLRSVVR